MLAADSKVASGPIPERCDPAFSWKQIMDPVEPFLEAVSERLTKQVRAFDPEPQP